MKRPNPPVAYSTFDWRTREDYEEAVEEYKMELQAYFNALYLKKVLLPAKGTK